MSVVVRGAKNAVRSPIRTVSLVLLLGVAMAFALSLVLANQAVKNKIEDLKQSGATILTVRPAGSFGFQGGGDPLTTDNYESLKTLPNVVGVSAQLDLNTRRMIRFDGPGSGGTATTTEPQSKVELESAIDTGQLGIRNFGTSNGDEAVPITPPKIPVGVTGVSGNADMTGKAYTIKAGTFLTSSDGYQALVSTQLATKNNLKVGSSFKAYDQTFTVIGIYDTGTEFGNNSVVVPLKTAQKISDQSNEVSTMVVQADSIENLSSVESAIKNRLGSDKVDVTSPQQNTSDALASLKAVQRISLAGVVIAVGAAAVILFLVMVMIVRERRREIAVLKAIGGSNSIITLQFMTEAVVLTLLSVIVGSLMALAFSDRLTSSLISSNTKAAETTETDAPFTRSFRSGRVGSSGGGPVGQVFRVGGPGAEQETAKDLIGDVKTSVGPLFLVEGLAAVIIIGALGSAIPAYSISKIRPAEVMRGE